MIELILGGARSGKSRHAEQCALQSESPVTYVATATAGDEEMADRIRHHRSRRPGTWACIEEPVALGSRLASLDAPGHTLLVDCLTLWCCNALFHPDGGTWEREREQLLATLPSLRAHTLLVSNEVGWGIIPMGAETRRYVDELGRLHQDIALLADRVTLVVAGLPHLLKGQPR